MIDELNRAPDARVYYPHPRPILQRRTVVRLFALHAIAVVPIVVNCWFVVRQIDAGALHSAAEIAASLSFLVCALWPLVTLCLMLYVSRDTWLLVLIDALLCVVHIWGSMPLVQ